MITHRSILSDIDHILDVPKSEWHSSLTGICNLLQESVSYYNWVGFYFANYTRQSLHLKAFSGLPTEHVEIPFGKGICGQVALSNQNFVVPDVQHQDNYIACDLDVKSELVVPLFVNGKNVGQIDIDSNTINPFTKQDEKLLAAVNSKVAEFIPKTLYILS